MNNILQFPTLDDDNDKDGYVERLKMPWKKALVLGIKEALEKGMGPHNITVHNTEQIVYGNQYLDHHKTSRKQIRFVIFNDPACPVGSRMIV